MTKTYFLTILWFGAVILAVHSQLNEPRHPLVLITASEHSFVSSIEQLNQLIPTIPTLQAITLNTPNSQLTIEKLRQLSNELQMSKQKVTSLQVTPSQLQTIAGVTFKPITTIEEFKKALQQSGMNLLLEIVETQTQSRLLQETHQQVISTPGNEASEQRSQLFANMDSATLTGLLVSLFLILMLLVAINCLYEIKTNDSFGRTNLWVGKES